MKNSTAQNRRSEKRISELEVEHQKLPDLNNREKNALKKKRTEPQRPLDL